MPDDVKEVQMDMPVKGSRRKRRAGTKKTRDSEGGGDTVVTKDVAAAAAVAAPVNKSIAPTPVVKKIVQPTSVPSLPKVVLAPAKKKTPKVMLVPKGKPVVRSIVADRHKTFKAKRVKVTIDNTAKTQKQRRTLIAKVDALTDDQIRAAAVKAGLSRHETVAKAPIGLLRQMVKDYQTMKGLLL
jgi:hypothetical protein